MRLPNSRVGVSAGGSAMHQIVDGYRYVYRTPVLFWLLVVQTFTTMFMAMFFPIVPAVAVEVLDVSATEFGWMWVALAVGQGISALLLSVIGGFKRNGAAMIVAAIIFSVCMFFFGLAQTYWLATALLLGMGLAFPLWVAASMTLLQNFSAPEYRGRVMAVFGIGMQALSVSWLLGGWLLDLIGIFPTVLVALGGGWVVLATVMIASKELRTS